MRNNSKNEDNIAKKKFHASAVVKYTFCCSVSINYSILKMCGITIKE